MRIRKQDTMAVVIDYQERILPAMDNWEELLRKSEILLKGLKAMEIPMVLTTQYAKEPLARSLASSSSVAFTTW